MRVAAGGVTNDARLPLLELLFAHAYQRCPTQYPRFLDDGETTAATK